MLGDYYIHQSLYSLFNLRESTSEAKTIFVTIYNVTTWYVKQLSGNKKDKIVSQTSNDKLDFLIYFSKHRRDNKNFNLDKFVEEIKGNKHWKVVESILEDILDDSPTEDKIQELYEYFLKKDKLHCVFKEKSDFKDLLSNLELGNFEDDSAVIKQWETSISSSYNTILDIKKKESIKSAESLNLKDDDCGVVLDKFVANIDQSNVVRTGFKLLDDSFSAGGFEKRKLYICAGSTGVGKSTIMINFICNSISHDVKTNNNGNLKTYLYITAENLIDETLIRFYCCLTDTAQSKVMKKLKYDKTYTKTLSAKIKEFLDKSNSNVQFYYVPAKKTTVYEIESLIDVVKNSEDDKNHLKAVFIDYLDLIKSGNESTKELRHELGDVTMAFKNLSINYDVPVITASQLNRSGYNADSASLTQIGESNQKAENSDVIISLQHGGDSRGEKNNENGLCVKVVNMTVLKNRGGKSGDHSEIAMIENVNGDDRFSYKMVEMSKIEQMEDGSEIDEEVTIEHDEIDIDEDDTPSDGFGKPIVIKETSKETKNIFKPNFKNDHDKTGVLEW